MELLLEADRAQVPLGTFRFNSDETRTIKIGSLKSAHIRLPGLPRMQAVIHVVAEQASIIDVGGGMYVNGAPTHRWVVTDGDAVCFGPVTLRARIGDEVLAEQEPEAEVPAPIVIEEQLPDLAELIGPMAGGDFALLDESFRPFYRRRRRKTPTCPPRMPPERPVSEAAHALELRLYWGESILDLRHYERPQAVTIGESKQADILLSSDGLPVEAFPLVRTVGGRYLLCFTAEMSGELEMDGRVASLSEWRHARARPDPTLPGTFSLPLSLDARAVVRWAGMSFALRFVSPARRVSTSITNLLDLPYVNTLLLSTLFHLLLLLGLAVFPYDAKELQSEDQEALVFVLNAPPILFAEPPVPSAPQPALRSKARTELRAKSATAARRDGDSAKAPERFREFFSSLGGSHRRFLAGNTGLTREIASLIRSARPGPREIIGFGLRGGIHRRSPAMSLRTVGEIETRRNIDQDFNLRPRRRRAGPDAIEIGPPVTSPGLTREQIAKVVRNNLEQIRYCYEKELYRFHELSGRVVTRWLIAEDGSVSHAEVVESNIENAAVEDCLVARIPRWRFPEPAGGGVVEVNYPFIFRAR